LILFVSATREELGDLPGEALGLGAIKAAASTAALIAREHPDGVVLIGTCGAYRGGPVIGSAVVARRLGLSQGVATMGLGYVPHAPEPLACDPSLTEGIYAPRVDVLTVHAITTDPVLADRLADGWQVEHMEAYGAAQACAHAGIPFAAILGVASEVGHDAHTHWLLHRLDAQAHAREAAAPLLAPRPLQEAAE
jgi:futalosine hydrolase